MPCTCVTISIALASAHDPTFDQYPHVACRCRSEGVKSAADQEAPAAALETADNSETVVAEADLEGQVVSKEAAGAREACDRGSPQSVQSEPSSHSA